VGVSVLPAATSAVEVCVLLRGRPGRLRVLSGEALAGRDDVGEARDVPAGGFLVRSDLRVGERSVGAEAFFATTEAALALEGTAALDAARELCLLVPLDVPFG